MEDIRVNLSTSICETALPYKILIMTLLVYVHFHQTVNHYGTLIITVNFCQTFTKIILRGSYSTNISYL